MSTQTMHIILSVCVVIIAFLGLHVTRKKKQCKHLALEISKSNAKYAHELQNARHREREAFSQCAQMKKALDIKTQELQIAEDKVKTYSEDMVRATKTMQEAREQFSSLQGQGKELEAKLEQLQKAIHHPSKSYLIKHLFKAYKIKSQADLAKALGVSKSAISRMMS